MVTCHVRIAVCVFFLLATTACAKEPAEAPTVAIGKTLRLGSLELTPVSVEFRKASVSRGGFQPETSIDGPYLVLTVRVKNVSEGQVFSPFCSASAKDNYGNKLESPFSVTEIATVEASKERDELYPGKEAILLLCIERKIPKASRYDWVIRTRISNEEEQEGYRRWLLKHSADEVVIK